MLYNVQSFNPGTAVASSVLKTTKGRLHWLYPTNNNAATRYVMVFDATALPANGTAPLLMFPLAGNSASLAGLAFPPDGLLCSNGIVIAISTSLAALAIGASTDLTFTAGYS